MRRHRVVIAAMSFGAPCPPPNTSIYIVASPLLAGGHTDASPLMLVLSFNLFDRRLRDDFDPSAVLFGVNGAFLQAYSFLCHRALLSHLIPTLKKP